MCCLQYSSRCLVYRSQEDVEHHKLLPVEPDHGGHHDGHTQLHLLFHLYAGQVTIWLKYSIHNTKGLIYARYKLLEC